MHTLKTWTTVSSRAMHAEKGEEGARVNPPQVRGPLCNGAPRKVLRRCREASPTQCHHGVAPRLEPSGSPFSPAS
jgi:hypothetical protein